MGASSTRRAKFEAARCLKVARVSSHQNELVLEGGGGDQGVGRSEASRTSQATGALGNSAIDG